MSRLRSGSIADAVVIGGGPAGSAVARLLSLWGRKVVLLTRDPGDRPGLAESVPPSAAKLFDQLEIGRSVAEAGFVRTPGNSVRWGGAPPRRVDFPDGPGWQVSRRRLDRLMLSLAEDAGATVRRGTVVEGVRLRDGPPSEVVARVPGSGSTGTARLTVRAPVVLDCSGRSGVVASRGLRRRPDAPRLTALVGAWRREGGWSLEEGDRTLVEAYEGGWAWSIPVDSKVRYVGAMIDPEVTDLRRASGLVEAYRQELAKLPYLSTLLSGAAPDGAPRACDATPYSSARFGGAGFLLVGDAASFIDPLSSYGVKKALASGWLAAVVTNTILEHPEMEEEAVAFFEAREREAFRSYSARTAAFYEEGAGFPGGPFWARRCRGATGAAPRGSGTTERDFGADAVDVPGLAGTDVDVDALRRDPAIQEAFARLRGAGEVKLGLSKPFETVRAPTVRGRTLVHEDRLRTPRFPGGIRHVRGVDLVAVARLCATHEATPDGVPELYGAYREKIGPVALADFLGALSLLLADDVVENSA